MLIAEMLSTGDEVLHGQIVDTNAAWLADYFFSQGLPLTSRCTVGDNLESLVTTLQQRSQYVDILIVNGGLGPTSDDLSAQAAALASGVELVLHQGWLDNIQNYFARRGQKMSPGNRKQALIPAGSEMIDNPVGTACGFALSLNRCLLVFTPGVPAEFKTMIQQQIMPLLRQRFPLPAPPLCLRMTTFGRAESELAQLLEPLPLPANVVLGYRSAMPIIELKLTGSVTQRQPMEHCFQTILSQLSDSVLFTGTEGLLAWLKPQLSQPGWCLRISEQFTAGLLAWQLRAASVELTDCQVLPERQQTLAETTQFAAIKGEQKLLCLAVGAWYHQHINIVLNTPQGLYGLRVRLAIEHHSLTVRQQTVCLLAQDLLRRWLTGRSLTDWQGWIEITEYLHIK